MHIFHPPGIEGQQGVAGIYLHIHILLKKSFPTIYNDNPTVASDVASKNIFTAFNFWTANSRILKFTCFCANV